MLVVVELVCVCFHSFTRRRGQLRSFTTSFHLDQGCLRLRSWFVVRTIIIVIMMVIGVYYLQ